MSKHTGGASWECAAKADLYGQCYVVLSRTMQPSSGVLQHPVFPGCCGSNRSSDLSAATSEAASRRKQEINPGDFEAND